MSGLELSKEVDAEFKELLKCLWLSPEYLYLIKDAMPSAAVSSALEKELKECVEEMVWQGYLAGLKDSRRFEPIYSIKCSSCGNGITENSKGEVITHELALEEDWTYDFDNEIYYCFDCPEPSDDS